MTCMSAGAALERGTPGTGRVGQKQHPALVPKPSPKASSATQGGRHNVRCETRGHGQGHRGLGAGAAPGGAQACERRPATPGASPLRIFRSACAKRTASRRCSVIHQLKDREQSTDRRGRGWSWSRNALQLHLRSPTTSSPCAPSPLVTGEIQGAPRASSRLAWRGPCPTSTSAVRKSLPGRGGRSGQHAANGRVLLARRLASSGAWCAPADGHQDAGVALHLGADLQKASARPGR
jgi:hypothetical protein